MSKNLPAHRPETFIDWKRVEVMILAGCSGIEIAASIMPKPIHCKTFYRRFKKEYGVGFEEYRPNRKLGGYGNIRTRQYIAALAGNNQMLKLLGEEWLGQGKNASGDSSNESRAIINISERLQKIEHALFGRATVLTDLEDEQSILHQESPRPEDQIPDELGTTDSLESEA
jgi:hypothetical protein